MALPLAVKLNPYFSAFGDLARRLDAEGADSLVLFNRLYQPDIDLTRLRWSNDVALSGTGKIRLGLMWFSVALGQLHALRQQLPSRAGRGDLLHGADAVMTTSALLRHGPDHLRVMLGELEAWLTARDFSTVAAIKGLMRDTHPDAEAEHQSRVDHIRSLTGYRGPMSAGEIGQPVR